MDDNGKEVLDFQALVEEEVSYGEEMHSADMEQIAGGKNIIVTPARLGEELKRIRAMREPCKPGEHDLVSISRYQSYCKKCGTLINY
ncbi:MAG: hypothetical protein IIZ39_09050 [Blautia sp.]|nr:hypothetical protein [Blautia sp.]